MLRMDGLNVLVMGSGVVGQVFAGHLRISGHHVTVLTRAAHVERFEEEGIALDTLEGRRIAVRDCRFVSEMEPLEGYDLVLACFRADQRAEVLALLRQGGPSEAAVALAFPVWRHSLRPEDLEGRPAFAMLPGLEGLYRDGSIFFKGTTTKIGPLFAEQAALMPEANTLAKVFVRAGLKAYASEHFVTDFQAIMAVGFPVLLALSVKGYHVDAALRDNELMRIAASAQQEALAILEAGGDSAGAIGKLFRVTPPGVTAALMGLARFGLTRFLREMLEVHFKKVHRQTLTLVEELTEFPFAEGAPRDYVLELCARCTR